MTPHSPDSAQGQLAKEGAVQDLQSAWTRPASVFSGVWGAWREKEGDVDPFVFSD